ncbi:UNVERIFIED_CONTAM: hypothetical protein FKN15_023643 [Acipenser sinensis]
MHVDIEKKTAIDWYCFMRDIVQEPVLLGGSGCIVQIDERVMVWAKYRHGRNLGKPDRWVFDIYQPDIQLGYLTFVERRNALSLLPIITKHPEWRRQMRDVLRPQNQLACNLKDPCA